MRFRRSSQQQQRHAGGGMEVNVSRLDENALSSAGPEFDQQVETLIPAEIRMISGCHSEQTSADLLHAMKSCSGLPNPAGRAGGACTSALLEILHQHAKNGNDSLTFQSLLLKLRHSLSSKGFEQIPQLSSSRPLEVQQTPFSLTNGPGQRRALLVGINYRGQRGELSGCHNDVINVKNYLMRYHGYSEDQILILMDDGAHQRRGIYPTRQKIILGLKQLVAHSQPGDNVYFHYSGHGGLIIPEDDGHIDGFTDSFRNAFKHGQHHNQNSTRHRRLFGNNVNNHLKTKYFDETLFPVDHNISGQIHDFSLFHHFVRPLKAGVTATCVLDCCHSGTVLDLPYQYRPTNLSTIRSLRSMDSLGNLAFFYLLAGNSLESLGNGFASVWHHVDQNLPDGTTVDDFQGAGVNELLANDQTDDRDFMASLSATNAANFDEEQDSNVVIDGIEDEETSGNVVGGDDNDTDNAVREFDTRDTTNMDTDNAVFVGPDGRDPVMIVQGHAVDVDPANEDYNQPPVIIEDGFTGSYPEDDYDDNNNGIISGDFADGFGSDMAFSSVGVFSNSTDRGVGTAADCCADEAAGASCGDVFATFLDATNGEDDDDD